MSRWRRSSRSCRSGRRRWRRRSRPLTLPAGRFAVAVHAGDYAGIDRSYGRLGSQVAVHSQPEPKPIREYYLVGPPHQPAQDYRTEIWWPIRPATVTLSLLVPPAPLTGHPPRPTHSPAPTQPPLPPTHPHPHPEEPMALTFEHIVFDARECTDPGPILGNTARAGRSIPTPVRISPPSAGRDRLPSNRSGCSSRCRSRRSARTGCTSISSRPTGAADIQRALAAGATHVGDFDEFGTQWSTLADVEGNVFDIGAGSGSA